MISFITPCYNAAATLRRAVGGLLTQKGDWELWLIDDGSTDDTAVLCDELAAQHEGIRVLHLPENCGSVVARNCGLERAGGDYVAFLDADDELMPGALEALEPAMAAEAQAIVYGMRVTTTRGTKVLRQEDLLPFGDHLTEPEDIHACLWWLESQTLFGYQCNKAYRLDFLRATGVRLAGSPLLEDFFFNAAIAPHITGLWCIDQPLYSYHRSVAGSLSTRFEPDYWPIHRRKIAVWDELLNAWDMHFYTRELGGLWLRYALSSLERNCDRRSGMDKNAQLMHVEQLREDPFAQVHLAPETPWILRLLHRHLQGNNPHRALGLGHVAHVAKKLMPGALLRR